MHAAATTHVDLAYNCVAQEHATRPRNTRRPHGTRAGPTTAPRPRAPTARPDRAGRPAPRAPTSYQISPTVKPSGKGSVGSTT